MPKIELTIDGRAVRVPLGASLLDAADAAGVYVPRLCALDGAPPRAVCRLCLVELEGTERPVAACATPARDGAEVRVCSEALDAMRRLVMELVLAEHDCADEPGCSVHRLAARLGISTTRFGPRAAVEPAPSGSGYVRVALDACVACDRCVLACRDLGVIARQGTRLRFDGGLTLAGSRCVDCGDCAAVCPAGALSIA